MFDAKKTVVVSVIAVLYVLQEIGIRAQPTIGFTSEDDSCSQLDEDWNFQVGENMHLRSALESERQKMKTMENSFRVKVEENDRLNLELESKQKMIETLGNASRAQIEEIQQLKLDLENSQEIIETLRNVSCVRAKENHTLKLEDESIRLKTPPVTATFIGSFDPERSHSGITKVEDKIYVLSHHDPIILNVYEDMLGFRFMTNITLSGTSSPFDIVYSNKSKCVYISDYGGRCIWMMTTTGEHRLTKWLNNVTLPNALSLSNEGHLFVLRRGEPFNQLEIYSLNATLILRLQLPQDIKDSRYVDQTSEGNFIIIHRLNKTSTGQWVMSQLTNDGKLIHRFLPRNQSEKLNDPYQLSLDSDNNRLFVAENGGNRVILFDSSDLTWSQVLLSRETNGIRNPCELFYDASKKYLFVVQCRISVTVYEIN